MLKKLRFFIPILFFLFMWLPLWADKSIKQLTTSGLATRAPALAIPEWDPVTLSSQLLYSEKASTRNSPINNQGKVLYTTKWQTFNTFFSNEMK